MIVKLVPIFLVIGVLLLSGCVGPQPATNTNQPTGPTGSGTVDGNLVLEDCLPVAGSDAELSETYEEEGLTLHYPSDWGKTTYLGTSHFVPPGEDAGGNEAVLNLEVTDAEKSFEEYSIENIDSIIGQEDVVGFYASCSRKLSGNPAVKLTFDNGLFQKSYIHAWTIKNDKLYYISFAEPYLSSVDYSPIVESILNAVEIS